MKAMKKLTSILLTLILLLGVAPLSGMAYAEGNDGTVYTVTFDSAGGSAVKEQKIAEGEKANEPDDPAWEGYSFSGWFTEKDTRFNFNTPITENLRLVAKWTENAPAPSNEGAQERTEAQEAAGETPSEPEFPEAIDKAPARGGLRGPGDIAIDAVNFPDDNFRAIVAWADFDSDGYLSAAELAAIITMNCLGQSIASLQGVEFFTALTKLDCNYNNLTTLDVSQNSALTVLGCEGNNLTTLDVSQNSALTVLGCEGNNLTTLDVSQNSALTYLACYGNNLATLDVSAVPALKDAVENGSHDTSYSEYDKYKSALGELRVDKTVTIMTDAAPLGVAIDAVNFPDANFRAFVAQYDLDSDGYLSAAELAAVTTMDCSEKSIASLQGVEFFTALTELDCSYNNLTTLDVSQNTALTYLSCDGNNLATLDVSQNTALTELYCWRNNLATLDVSQNTALTKLNCDYNNLTTLDVSQNSALTVLSCNGNNLTTLDVSQNTALTVLDCSYNSLTTLDVSRNTALTELWCMGNNLTTLDVSQNTALTVLVCDDNNLTTLDVSQNTALTYLSCDGNNLATLDVSQNTALTDLSCDGNNLATLDVSQNSALTELSCNGNNLTTLDVSQNTALTELSCNGNNLTTLDVSQNTALTELSCNGNNLAALDVSQNSALTYLYCYGNNLATLDVSAVPALKDAVENGSHSSYSDYDNYYSALGNLRVDKTVTIMTDAAPAATYTVTFDANGHGTAPAAQTVENGKTATKPADPTESGWTFGGWYKEAACTNAFDFTTPITADITLYAKWTKAGGGEEPPVPITYTVTFDANGHGTALAVQTVEDGKPATKPADPTESGWTFGGWYTEAACTNAFDFSTPITANITLYAKWTKDGGDPVPATKYTITYVLNGGALDGKTGTVTVQVEDGAVITLPKPTRNGYTFDYWEGSRYNAGASYTVTGDHTFTARWKSNTTGIGGNDTSPKTGDNSHIGLWIALMAISLIGLGGMTVYGKGRKRRTSR